MMSQLRILILTPTALPTITGNAMTAERWRQGLIREGCHVEVLTTRNVEFPKIGQAVARFRPDIIHVHHLFQSGSLLMAPPLTEQLQGIPVAATPAGTDLNQDLRGEGKIDALQAICARVGAIVVQNRWFARLMEDLFPVCERRIIYVPKSFFWLGDEPCALREQAKAGPNDFLFFLPAGVRPVKGNLEGLLALEKVHQRRPQIRAVFAGTALDRDYSARFQEEIRRLQSFACWLPAISPPAMRSAYQAADIVLNTSFSEGLSNVLLEAIASGKPLLATNIEGNRWPIQGDEGGRPCGLFYDPQNMDDFIEKAIRLSDDGALRSSMAQTCRERAAAWPSPDMEIKGLIAAYQQAINVGTPY
ncbi:MAG: glycosyltransferase [Deltaproteobacteria bacterium]|nr:glycosyltransferase [Deltaproteobacteria bacterium]